MQTLILGYIAAILTGIFFEIKNHKKQKSLNLNELNDLLKKIEIGTVHLGYVRSEIEDLNKRFKDRGF